MNTRKFGRKQLDEGANFQIGNEADFKFRALAFRKTTISLEIKPFIQSEYSRLSSFLTRAERICKVGSIFKLCASQTLLKEKKNCITSSEERNNID